MASEAPDSRMWLLHQWAGRCAARGTPADTCRGPEALHLVTAVQHALARGAGTGDLGRAARSFGARFASPAQVIAVLSALREALVADAGILGLADRADALHRVLDQLMAEAVDAASSQLRHAARSDPLTGCANRRAFHEDLVRALGTARSSGLDLAVAAVDLDGLKRINDTDGHAAGDAALLGLVATLQASLREADGLYRIGGDEFAVLAPFTDAPGAAELMRRAERSGGPAFSWGVASTASLALARDDPEALLRAADADLYARRRAARRARLLAEHRQRARTVASVAAMVATTVMGAVGIRAGFGHSGVGPAGAGHLAAGIWPPDRGSGRAPGGLEIPPDEAATGPTQPSGSAASASTTVARAVLTSSERTTGTVGGSRPAGGPLAGPPIPSATAGTAPALAGPALAIGHPAARHGAGAPGRGRTAGHRAGPGAAAAVDAAGTAPRGGPASGRGSRGNGDPTTSQAEAGSQDEEGAAGG